MKTTIFNGILFYSLKDYEGLYSISKCGKMLSHRKHQPNGGFRKEKILSTSINKSGYEVVRISKDSISITKTLHRLLLKNFIENINNLKAINHKDGNKLNNNLNNLEWCSFSDNLKHAWKTKLLVPSEKFSKRASIQFLKNFADKQRKLNNELANQIKNRYLTEKISMKKLGKDFNVSSQTVCNIIHGKIYLV